MPKTWMWVCAAVVACLLGIGIYEWTRERPPVNWTAGIERLRGAYNRGDFEAIYRETAPKSRDEQAQMAAMRRWQAMRDRTGEWRSYIMGPQSEREEHQMEIIVLGSFAVGHSLVTTRWVAEGGQARLRSFGVSGGTQDSMPVVSGQLAPVRR